MAEENDAILREETKHLRRSKNKSKFFNISKKKSAHWGNNVKEVNKMQGHLYSNTEKDSNCYPCDVNSKQFLFQNENIHPIFVVSKKN